MPSLCTEGQDSVGGSPLLEASIGRHLFWRLGGLVCLFAVELTVFTVCFDTGNLIRHTGFTGWFAENAARLLEAVIAGISAFLALQILNGVRGRGRAPGVISRIQDRLWIFVCHVAVVACMAVTATALFKNQVTELQSDLLLLVALAFGICAILTAALAFWPGRLWLAMLRTSGGRWKWGVAVGCLVYPVHTFVERLWYFGADLNLWAVAACLRLFLDGVFTQSTDQVIGTSSFSVSIGKQCSGIEGAGLIFVFGALYLWVFRHKWRFPHALVILPIGMAIMLLLNVLRIALLILIGNAGAPKVALGGFHSQAGWIAFNAVAIGLMWIFPRISCLRKDGSRINSDENSSKNPTAAYLVPFLTILAAAMLSKAVASRFEWLYALRLVTAGIALWWYRSYYRGFAFGRASFGVAIGIVVFAVWMILDGTSGPHDDYAMASWLAGFTPGARIAWIVLRITAAVVIVPVAEELAFRGFLLRRTMSPNFESVTLRRSFYVSAFLISSLAFGVLHGGQWIAGTAAGGFYALAFIWRGRLWDAIVAHASTNALIAVWVIAGGNWHLW